MAKRNDIGKKRFKSKEPLKKKGLSAQEANLMGQYMRGCGSLRLRGSWNQKDGSKTTGARVMEGGKKNVQRDFAGSRGKAAISDSMGVGAAPSSENALRGGRTRSGNSKNARRVDYRKIILEKEFRRRSDTGKKTDCKKS